MFDKIFIVAGNHMQYYSYVQKKFDECVAAGKQFNQSAYTYVSSPDIIRGHRPVHGFFIGTFNERPDIDLIKLQIRLANRV